MNVAVKSVQAGTVRLPQIAGAVAEEAKALSGPAQQSQTSMRELQPLIEAMQHHWHLRKYVNQTKPASARPSSDLALPAPVPNSLRRPPEGFPR